MRITIDKELAIKVDNQISNTKFESIDEYVNFVVRESVKNVDKMESSEMTNSRDISEQLEDLGYL